MGTHDIARDFAALCKAGRFEEAGDKYWSDDIVSREAMEGPMAELRGRKAVEAKGAWWYENHEVHGVETEGPYVNGNQFMLRFRMDVTVKATGVRQKGDEMGLYTVRDGKVVEEAFFYAEPPG